MKTKKIVMIGAGNVAHHLAPALLKAGFGLCQIYSRTPESARELGMKTGISFTHELFAVYPDCDIYIFTVKDDALSSLLKAIRVNANAIMLHTSGSVPMNIFSGVSKQYGVIYPFQTFSKKRELVFKEIPLFVEASDKVARKTIMLMASELSDNVQEMSSEVRMRMHLAGIFANNFTNHLYRISENLVREHGLDFNVLRPLIYETAHKVMSLLPVEAQTGPAVRNDETIINKHKQLLKDNKTLLSLYNLLSNSIRSSVSKEDSFVEIDDNQLSLW
ncbi:MAG: DUF2520 domain-containing protein [Culturomica sp.]|jgi:predicted short-subunit dehydrogenase-like oxidoreductase (DUF2520 family)|nr:DUF2520 domain-containing protein [Culturomica sp.]